MKKIVSVFVLLFFFLTIFGLNHSEDFFGIAMEFQKIDFITDFSEGNYFKDNNLNLIFTYGPKFSGPIRFRIGAGSHDLSFFYVNGGVELRLLEFLNSLKGRLFGLYLIADLKMGIDYVEAALKGEIYIPISAIGGIQLGFGVNHDADMVLSIAYTGGIYPLIIDQ